MDMPRDDEIRLAMGEMTPDQMRTARAAIRWILSRSARPEAVPIEKLRQLDRYNIEGGEAWGEGYFDVEKAADGRWVKWFDLNKLLEPQSSGS